MSRANKELETFRSSCAAPAPQNLRGEAFAKPNNKHKGSPEVSKPVCEQKHCKENVCAMVTLSVPKVGGKGQLLVCVLLELPEREFEKAKMRKITQNLLIQ